MRNMLLFPALRAVANLPGRARRFIDHHLEERKLQKEWWNHGRKWALSQSTIGDTNLEISGWALAPPWRRDEITFRCNGRVFDHVQYPIVRADVAAAFPHAPWATMSGFVCRTKLPTPIPPGGRLKCECVIARTGKPLVPSYYPFNVRQPSPNDPPLPDDVRRQRVTMVNASDAFLSEGYSQFERLQDICRDVTGCGFEGRTNILDWGCGSGRICRYFTDRTPATFTGVDVDPYNVNWCSANLPFGRFRTIPLHPRTELADGEFDLVIGLSVFTHLREPDQFEWLEELRRVTRPGAVLLLTIHAETHFWIMPTTLSPELSEQRRRTGFVAAPNVQYDAKLAEAEYYQNIFHNHEYIRKNWSKYFNIRGIVPGCIGNQDVVIAERRV